MCTIVHVRTVHGMLVQIGVMVRFVKYTVLQIWKAPQVLVLYSTVHRGAHDGSVV